MTPVRVRLRLLGGNLALAASALIAVLLAGEVAARLFGRVGPTLIVKDPVVGKRYLAGFAGDVFVPEAGRDVWLRFDRDGFRNPDRELDPRPGVRRVAVLGDSMTVAVATDEGKTFTRLLEQLLNRREPARWEVLNVAVSSASTAQELVYYREVAARYHPAIVICAFYVGNDFADNSIRLTRAPRLYFDLDEKGGLRLRSLGPGRSPVADWLDQHSRFYVWQKVTFAAARARARAWQGALDVGDRIFETGDDPDLVHGWKMTEQLLRALRDEVRAHQAQFLIAVIPCAEEVRDDLWSDLVERARPARLDRRQPERRLQEIGGRLGVPVVAMGDAFREEAAGAQDPARAADLFISGRFHLNDAGHFLAAGLLHQAIAEGLSSRP